MKELSTLSFSSFSADEQVQLMEKIIPFYKNTVLRYLGLSSSSISEEKAREILSSVLFVLDALILSGYSKNTFMNEDIALLFGKGKDFLQKKKASCKANLDILKNSLPSVTNIYFTDTVRNLDVFFANYDIDYAADQIPGSFDYWLLCPSKNQLKGVFYIEEYIRSLQLESDFIHCFPENKVLELYRHIFGNYKEAFFNLSIPVLTNAIGLSILGKDVLPLSVDKTSQSQLQSILSKTSTEDLGSVIDQAIINIGHKMYLNPNHIEYLLSYSPELIPSLSQAINFFHISNIFIRF